MYINFLESFPSRKWVLFSRPYIFYFLLLLFFLLSKSYGLVAVTDKQLKGPKRTTRRTHSPKYPYSLPTILPSPRDHYSHLHSFLSLWWIRQWRRIRRPRLEFSTAVRRKSDSRVSVRGMAEGRGRSGPGARILGFRRSPGRGTGRCLRRASQSRAPRVSRSLRASARPRCSSLQSSSPIWRHGVSFILYCLSLSMFFL